MKKIDKYLKLSFISSFMYVLMGTIDNLTGLKIEESIIKFFPSNPFYEFLVIFFYGLSYLPSRMLALFFNNNDIIFIIFQILMLFCYSFLFYSIIKIIQHIRKTKATHWVALLIYIRCSAAQSLLTLSETYQPTAKVSQLFRIPSNLYPRFPTKGVFF